MRFSIVTAHLPELEGVAPGRVTRAAGTGLLDLGHEVELWTWNRLAPTERLPSWCRWEPLPDGRWIDERMAALLHPRSDVLRAGWTPPPGVVALADESSSFPAVAPSPTAALLVHQLVALDMRAARVRPSGSLIQRMRAQRTAISGAPLVLCTSPRVARAIGGNRVAVVPITHAIGPAIAPVEEPVAGILANWRWPPNARALALLMRSWPAVRDRVPGARLLLGGHGLDGIGHLTGVEVIGTVAHSADVLERISVLAFPCPPSTGAKIKVLEAIGRGIPVVTSPHGVEGLRLSPGRGAVVVPDSGFVDGLAALLRDPARRSALGASGRADIVAQHAPGVAAAAWAAACERLPGIA